MYIKEGLVMLAIIAIISLIIICATIIIGMYIYYCAQKEVKMFAKSECISLHDLQLLMRGLMADIQQIKREIQDMNGKTEENSFKKEETSCSSVTK